MMKHLVLLVLIFQFFSCSSPTVSLSDLSEGDSLYVTNRLSFTPSIIVHKMSMSGKDHNLGYVPLDSNYMSTLGWFNDTQFHKEIGTSYIGNYVGPCIYDRNKIEIKLSPKIINIIKSNLYGNLLESKIARTKKELLQGDVSKGDIVESFPDKIYVDLDDISKASADSLFNY